MVDPVTPTGAGLEEEVRALLILDQLPGVGPRRIDALVRRFGSAVAALGAPAKELAHVAGADAAAGRADDAHRRRVDEGLALAARTGILVRCWEEPGYPERLRALHDPPPVLFLRGRPELLDHGGVAVVGARRATSRGRDLAGRLGGALGRVGVPVVSGLALGIDGEAHRGALDAGGDTLAVVGRGADAAYPPSHARLFRRIVERGLVVSEFLPGAPPLPHHFPRRNRIMAALSDRVVVVEAGARSGALITVEHALDLGKDVWAVPGPIDTRSCLGSNQLLAEGARPLVSLDRFAAEIRPAADDVAADPPTAGAAGPDEWMGSEPERRLLASLADGPLHVDAVAVRADLPVPLALSLLVELELRGSVEQLPGLLFRAA